ncbi:PTS transporter subunit EIIC [uncultured Clostridium sp.]|uniref:PTS sugar transporter subunit IIC n=1 Tax=uncultured Clostridium sp. TaxID=59620 RepID=UPI0026328CBD|nr:PTS transporter subunit EIIC [uncultured Clostridium sp.]
MKFMDKLAAGLEKFLMPIAEKLGRQKQLSALRDGFISTLPIAMAGAMGSLVLNALVRDTSVFGEKLNKIDAYAQNIQPFLTKYIQPILGNMWWGTIALTSIFLVIAIAYAYGRIEEVDPFATALVCLGAFLTMVPDTVAINIAPEGAEAVMSDRWGMISVGSFNSTAMFTAMLVALIGGWIFVKLTKKGIVIRMPEQVPPAVSKAFAAVIPALVVIALAGLVHSLSMNLAGMDFKAIIEKTIQDPLVQLGQSPFTYVFLILLSQLLWFFGLHGLNMVEPALNTMYTPALNANIDAVTAGGEAVNTLTRNFVDVYAMPGGSGGTLALLIAIFIFSKRQENRELAKLAIAPGCFNINEPVIFGLPLVLNPIYFIPFVLTPSVCIVLAYLATEAGLVSKISASLPWVTPPVFHAVLATNGDIRAGILAAALLLLSVLIWTPFVIAANKMGIED